MELRTVGVIGAGVIGGTVAQDLAQTKHTVVLVDVDDATIEDALGRIASAARFHHMIGGGEKQQVAEVMERITGTTDYAALADVDFVIENVTEDRAVKRQVYRQLDEVCAADCVVAANTSVIPISTIGSYSNRPENVIGVHFMNPAPLKHAVELIRGKLTSDRTVARTEQLLEQMGKRAIPVTDSPGFVSNRVLMLSVNEAARLVEEHVADAQSVDDVFKSCFGHKMGPLETADLIGLDTVLRSIEELRIALPEGTFTPCQLLQTMVSAGRLGRKTGAGFHNYGATDAPEGGTE